MLVAARNGEHMGAASTAAASVRSHGGSADEATAKLAHDRVLLHARGSHGDLTAHRSVTAWVHRRQEAAPQRRQIREVANRTTEGGTPRLVLTPDVVHGLARDRDPTARFAGDLDHAPRVRLRSAIVPIRRSSGVISGHWPRPRVVTWRRASSREPGAVSRRRSAPATGRSDRTSAPAAATPPAAAANPATRRHSTTHTEAGASAACARSSSRRR
jgi:hypothetical protein